MEIPEKRKIPFFRKGGIVFSGISEFVVGSFFTKLF